MYIFTARGRIQKTCGERTLVASVHLWRLITGLFVNKHKNRERFGDFGKRSYPDFIVFIYK